MILVVLFSDPQDSLQFLLPFENEVFEAMIDQSGWKNFKEFAKTDFYYGTSYNI